MMKKILFGLSLTLSTTIAANSFKTIPVIAVEYPPYTTQSLPNNGILFEELNAYAKQHFSYPITPLFLPPARAQQHIDRGNWCVSFYPPDSESSNIHFVKLAEKPVYMRLIRLRQEGEFSYKELSQLSGRVAILRTQRNTKLIKTLVDANLKPTYVETVRQGLDMLFVGRVNYVHGESEYLTTEEGHNYAPYVQLSKNHLSEVKQGFFYNKNCKVELFSKKLHPPL